MNMQEKQERVKAVNAVLRPEVLKNLKELCQYHKTPLWRSVGWMIPTLEAEDIGFLLNNLPGLIEEGEAALAEVERLRAEQAELLEKQDRHVAALVHVGQIADDYSSETHVLIGFAITEEAGLGHPAACEHKLFPCPECHGYRWDPEYGVDSVERETPDV